MAAASAFVRSWSVLGDTVFRGICSGLVGGLYFNGVAISDRPDVRAHGSTDAGGGDDFVPKRPTRSPKLMVLLFSGPVTET
jgi:hypothetical protein